MALNNLGLGMTITATNLASGTLRRVRADVTRTSASTVLAGRVMRGAFATAAVGAATLVTGVIALRGILSLADVAGEFQQGIAAVGAVANATTAELDSLRNAAIQAGIETQFSPTEAVEGLTSLITAGQTATQATRTLIPVLDLAAGSLGQLGVAGAAEAVVGTLNSYQLAADEASGVTDRLLRITQLTNFQTRDFSAGLAKAASAGAVFGQDLDDVLITMGLLRNANIDASSSSTAFRESVRRLGSDQRAQHAITAQGIDLFDEQTGDMRSVVDVMLELTTATADMGDEERNRIAATAFGARGLLAFNAVSQATFTTMRDGVEVTLQGVDAIAALRGELDDAAGTAERFREQLLDTFAGQKQLLTGTIQTLGVVLGESFARIFKPFVSAIVNTLNAVLQFFNDLPDAAKDSISAFVIFAAVGFTLLGIFLLLTAGGVLLVLAFKAIIITLAVMAIIIPPVIAGFVFLGAVIAAFVLAARENIGGFGDFLEDSFGKVKLVFRGLVQLFSDGGFSGAVREEMNAAGNQGVRRFVVTLFRVGSRVISFFRGLGAAFGTALTQMAPLFKSLRNAFVEIADAFGLVGDSVSENLGTLDGAAGSGARFGAFLATVFETVVRGAIFAGRAFAGFVRGARAAFKILEPVFDRLFAAFEQLGEAIFGFQGDAADNLGRAGDGAGTMGAVFGAVFAEVVGVVAAGITTFVEFSVFIVRFVRSVNRQIQMIDIFFSRLAISVESTWLDIVDSIRNALDLITAAIGDAALLVPAAIRPAAFQDLIEAGQTAGVSFQARAVRGTTRDAGEAAARTQLDIRAADIRFEARGARDEALIQGVREAMSERRKTDRERLQVDVKIDGEVIARAAAEGARSDAARGFNSAPSEVGG